MLTTQRLTKQLNRDFEFCLGIFEGSTICIHNTFTLESERANLYSKE